MKTHFRFLLPAAAGCLALSLAACSSAPAASGEAPAEAAGTYAYHIGGYDWGGRVDEVTLSLDKPLDKVTPETFDVKETVETDEGTTKENNLTVSEAWISRAMPSGRMKASP